MDPTLRGHEKKAAIKMMKLAMKCIKESIRRPSMGQIVCEVEKIQREFNALHYYYNNGEIGGVTLGSDLFK